MRVFEAVCLVIVIVCLLLAFALLRKTAEMEIAKKSLLEILERSERASHRELN